jgi:hypothetical protein
MTNPTARDSLALEVGIMAGRLCAVLDRIFPERAQTDLRTFLREATAARAARQAPPSDTPLGRLIATLSLSAVETDLLILAGMPEEHEGFAAIFRTLHPAGEPRPTLGLAAQLYCHEGGTRDQFAATVEQSALFRHGVLRPHTGAPFYERTLELADALWSVLRGADIWPTSVPRLEAPVAGAGLEDWLSGPEARRAIAALQHFETCTVLVTAESEETAFHRGLALVEAAGVPHAGIAVPAPIDAELENLVRAHALARGVVQVRRMPMNESPTVEVPPMTGYPAPVVICGRTGAARSPADRPLFAVPVHPLTPAARRDMWRQTLPALAAEASSLAARYPVEPALAAQVAQDLRCIERLESRAANPEDVGASVRARSAVSLAAGVRLIHPAATWEDLVLPPQRAALLQEAAERLDCQARVLDDWGFLKNRPGSRGVRMLFSGPPGTGKTLCAEVLAKTQRVDLLFVDVSRVVSKWLGETEKNLAAVFDTAERARAALFFDEADALFGKRTEVSDAHDRYANLETAYLLARLERFDGLAILATNLRRNIDPAFIRRLEFVVDFEMPDRDERVDLWRVHLPKGAPVAAEVDLKELAAVYPVVGSFIRNAAVAAAFLAAADGGVITRNHFLHAIRREYEKTGRAFPGYPAGSNAI